MLDLSDRLVVIIGGGKVAARKAGGVLAAGALRLRVVAPRFAGEFPPAVERVAEAYRAEHLDGAGLVFAATDSTEVNDAVVAEARRRGIWASRADADEHEPGDFTTPALLRRGALTVAVSAAGAPALAAAVRDALAEQLDDAWVHLAAAMQSLRPIIRTAGLLPDRRRQIFRDLSGEEALAAVAEGPEALRAWLVSRYPELEGAM